MENTMRKVEVLKDGNWITVHMKDLVEGDTFRMFESTGEPVIDPMNNRSKWKVIGSPYLNEDQIWTVKIDSYEEE